MRSRLILARIASEAGDEHWRTHMTAGRHELLGDEPKTLGGGDVGPPPFAYLLAGLVSCTSVTVRMYAEKHAIPLQRIEVDAKVLRNEEEGINSVERQVRLIGDLDDSDRAKLERVAERTPVTLAIKEGLAMISTYE
jgi:putative redox protein